MKFQIKHNLYRLFRVHVQPGNYFLVLSFFFLSLNGFSQFVPVTFKKTADSLIAAAPKTNAEIESVLKPLRGDTILMRYFSEVSADKKYLDGQTYALNQLGRKYRNISQFDKALALHKRAIELATKSENIELKIYSLNMLSVVFRKLDAIKSALDFNQEALELAEAVENPNNGIKRSINVSLNGIGNIYQTLEQYDLAIEQFKTSMKLEEELGNKLGLAINNQNIGECYEAQGKLEEGLQSFKTSLGYNEEIDSQSGIVICKNSIAHIYVHQGKTIEAIDILEEVLEIAEGLGDKDITLSVHITLGWAMMEMEKFKRAKEHLYKGLEMAKKYNIPSAISEANKFLSDLYAKQGDFKRSLEYYKTAKRYDKEYANDRNLRYVNDMIIRYDTEKRVNEIEVLAKQNEIVKLELRKNNTILLISGIILALLAGIFYILYRQYELKNEKKLLTLEQTMLRSQMNPHFLFNSLNSIKLYIINNEKKNAVHYLNKFSKLVRKILEASSLKEIPLAEELETVELYMNIENIRFSNEINFNTVIEEGIDIHRIKIPSLILQPFLENALWHGLSSKKGEKSIDLHISKDEHNGFINISITDNGIGREAAEKIKKNKVLKRKSVGIDITKERLANFSRDYLNSFDIEIIDLYDLDNTILGTEVILHIPTV